MNIKITTQWISRCALLILVLICIPNFPTKAESNANNISIKAEIDRSVVTIGDPIEYTVTIRHHPDIKILTRIPPPASDILKIKQVRDIQEKEGSDIIEGRKFTLSTFRLGEYILYPIKIDYRTPDQEIKSLETNRLFITVKSVAEGENQKDIRGIKSVVEISANIKSIYLLLIVFILALIAFFVYRRFLLRRLSEDASPPAPTLSPEEEAYLKLNELYESSLIRENQIKLFYLRLSDILGHYFERRFMIQALEATSYEILQALKEKNVSSSTRNLIEEVLSAADLAKFAKWRPEAHEIVKLHKQSKEIIQLSDPNKQEASHGI